MAGLPLQALLDSGAARVGLFFAVSVVVATTLGAALGDVRQGVETGISVGFLMAAFALLFVRSADDEEPEGEAEDGEE
jgi:hypothetical protein